MLFSSRSGLQDVAKRRLVGNSNHVLFFPTDFSESYEARKLGENMRPSVTVTSPTSPDPTRLRTASPRMTGRIQVKLWFDVSSLQLVVTVVRAAELPCRTGGQLRNPYAKLFLLPDRRLGFLASDRTTIHLKRFLEKYHMS